MKVGIIGTGNMGRGIAKLLASKGVQVAIGDRDPAKASTLAQEIGAESGGIAAAAKLADIVVLAVWYQHYQETIRAAGDLPDFFGACPDRLPSNLMHKLLA